MALLRAAPGAGILALPTMKMTGTVNSHGSKDLSSKGSSASIDVEADDYYFSPTFIKAAAGQVNPPHVHLGPADFFVLSGRLEYRGGAAGPGAYVREPAGAVHDATTTPVETVYLANVQGPIAFFGPDGTISHVSTGEQIRKRWQAQQARPKR